MTAYTVISIIYNPNSTGNGEQLAKELKKNLLNKNPKLDIKLVETQYAGHAEKLAYTLSKETQRPLILSASGDGGYHEVVNGIAQANSEGANAVTGLLPAGNANDHYKNLHSHDIVSSILSQKEHALDLLTIHTTSNGKPFTRYAHSYIGIGLTPKVGQELNSTKLNWFNQIIIVMRVLLFLHPVKISVAGKRHSYDSIIFSNIGKMSKVLTLAQDSSTSDGEFEMTIFRRRSKLKLIKTLLIATTSGLRNGKHTKSFELKTVKPLLVQLDGEIALIDADSEVIIGIEQQSLRCIV